MSEYRYEHVKSITSTNDELVLRGRAGEDSGLILRADVQTKGRGRLGRTWESDAPKGLYMSILERPTLPVDKVPCLSLIMGLAVKNAIRDTFALETMIKWPNDIVVDSKKLSGILAAMELKMGTSDVDFVVIGVGVNVDMQEFTGEIKDTATSIGNHFKGLNDSLSKSIEKLEKNIVKWWDTYYNRFLEERDFCTFLEEYNNALVNKGREVRVLDPRGEYEGICEGVNERGELKVRRANEIREVAFGEVSVRGIYGYV